MFSKIVKLASIAMISTTALLADKVSISNDRTGDFLIAPLYIAKGDICSEIKVFNTNETSSILAKVVFRERIASHEVDLPIFLSPGDVWSGKVCQENKKVILRSNDDSNHPAAMDTLSRGKDLGDHSKNAGYRNTDIARGYVEIDGKAFEIKEHQKENIDFSKGYIEVYPIAQYYEGSKKKVHKNILIDRWDRLIDKYKLHPKLSRAGLDSYSLSGLVSFQTENQETSAIAMTAFKGAHDKQVFGEAINYSSQAKPELLLGEKRKWIF